MESSEEEPLRPRAALGAAEDEEVSLREWLDRPGRAADAPNCMHVFRQVADAVALAHVQGAVLSTARPSCLALSPLNRVAFVDAKRVQLSPEEGKEMLTLELNWYTSPEEVAGSAGTFASDVYRLGVLLVELFCTFESSEEKLRAMSYLKHRLLPRQLLLQWPKQASFCVWLLHPEPGNRPKMSEILQSEFLNEPEDSLEEREQAIKLKEEIEDQELLLEFLLHLQQRKQAAADQLHTTVCYISADIEEVLDKQLALQKNRESYLYLHKDGHSEEGEGRSLLHPLANEDSDFSGSRKRLRPDFHDCSNEEDNQNLAEGPRSKSHPETHENLLSKSSRLIKNFKKFEAAYFSTRNKLKKPYRKSINGKHSAISTGEWSIIGTEWSSVDDLASKEGQSQGTKSEWIGTFLEDLCKYLSYCKLNVRAVLRQGDLLKASSLVCSLGFDRDKDYFATPIVEMESKSKVSSICWNGYMKSHIASSDFEGVVQVWDVTRNQVLVEMSEHEKRVWSVDFSLRDPMMLASGSDDGTVKLWNINQAGNIGTIRTKANVCSVQFSPNSAYPLAIGSADHNIYIYDIRNFQAPMCTLIGHLKTVSCVKFVDSSTLVSASIDNSLKLWDISLSASRLLDKPLQTFTGHTNVKNFVGLSVSDGYIATGSETNEVFVYHKAFPMPVLSYKFNAVDTTTEFVSCVCWRGQSSILLAANSGGIVKLLEMV